MKVRLHKLSRYIRGWMNYFALSEYYRPLPELDEWIRRRIRMCYMKQWRYCRTRIGNLVKLGAVKKEAIFVGISSKGPWKLARTYGTQSGLIRLRRSISRNRDLFQSKNSGLLFTIPMDK